MIYPNDITMSFWFSASLCIKHFQSSILSHTHLQTLIDIINVLIYFRICGTDDFKCEKYTLI